MVEAVIAYPLTLLALMSVICLIMGLYGQAQSISELHTAMNEKSGNASETIEASNFDSEYVNLRESDYLLYHRIEGDTYDEARAGGLVRRAIGRDYRDSMEVIDEEEYIRCVDAAKGAIKKEV